MSFHSVIETEVIYSHSTCRGALRMCLTVLLLAVSTSGCGGGGESTTAAPAGQAPAAPAAPAAPSSVPTATTPPVTTPVPTNRAAPIPDPGEGGDEHSIRVPASFVLRAGGFVPSTISVPAFLAVQLTVRSGDGRGHRVLVRTYRGSKTLRVPAGGRAGVRLAGLRRGRYAVIADGGAARATLVSGVTPGP